MTWEEIDIHLLIWLAICAIIGFLVFIIISSICRIREHKRFMKYDKTKMYFDENDKCWYCSGNPKDTETVIVYKKG